MSVMCCKNNDLCEYYSKSGRKNEYFQPVVPSETLSSIYTSMVHILLPEFLIFKKICARTCSLFLMNTISKAQGVSPYKIYISWIHGKWNICNNKFLLWPFVNTFFVNTLSVTLVWHCSHLRCHKCLFLFQSIWSILHYIQNECHGTVYRKLRVGVAASCISFTNMD